MVFLMSAAYAAFNTRLDVTGTSNITNTWSVEIINVTNGTPTGTAENATAPIISSDKLTASMAANLYAKGDAMSYVVTVKNKGTLPAKIADIIKNVKTQNDAIKISFSGYAKNQRLEPNATMDVTVTIEYDSDYNGPIDYNTPAEVEITLDYEQGPGGETPPVPIPDTYLVAYDCTENGGGSCTENNEYLESGATVSLSKTASKNGYTFVGWNTNKDATTALSVAPTVSSSNITLYAIYSKTLSVTYSMGTNVTAIGKQSDSCTAYNKNTTCNVTLPSITTASGYIADGWYNGETKVGVASDSYSADSNVTLTAKAISQSVITATFYYNSNTASGSTTIASKTESCTSTGGGSCTVNIPSEVIASGGTYNNKYVGLSESPGNMTAALNDSDTQVTISESKNYYALYRTAVTIYYPSSTSATSSKTVYQNQWFTSSSAMATTVLSSSQTGTTTNATAGTAASGYGTLVGFSMSANTTTPNWASIVNLATIDSGRNATKTVYQINKKTQSIAATFYYSNSNAGAKTSSQVSGTRTTYLKCTSNSAASTQLEEGLINDPATTAPYGTTFVGWATSASSMTPVQTINTGTTAYYAVYRSNVTNYYYDGSAYTDRSLYRNGYYGSSINYTMVLSTSETGTSNVTIGTGPGSSSFAGLWTAATEGETEDDFTTVAEAARSTYPDLYAYYQFTVAYQKGSNVSSIGKTTDACFVTTGNSCTVTLPSITPNSGYTLVGWNTTSGATTGTAAGQSYTITTSPTTLYANAVDTTGPTITLSPNTQTSYGSGGTAVTVTIADAGSGLAANQKIYYAWSTSSTTAPTYTSYVTTSNAAGANSTTVTVPASASSTLTGTYYLWIKVGTASDVAGNTNDVKKSALFRFDNTPPTLSASTSATTNSITVSSTASALSGITKYEFSKDGGTTWVDNGTNNTYTFTGLGINDSVVSDFVRIHSGSVAEHYNTYSACEAALASNPDDTCTANYFIKVRVTSGSNLTTVSSNYETPLERIPVPTYNEVIQGEVGITYPSGCTTFTCQYSLDDGATWTTVNGNTTAYVGQDGNVIARVTDGTNTETATTYSVIRNRLYVSSSGSDTTGYGTINYPYATVQKAYDSATSLSGQSSIIYLMSNISQSATATFDDGKTVEVTTCTKSGSGTSATCTGSPSYTLTKSQATSGNLFDLDNGTVTFSGFKLDGANISDPKGAISIDPASEVAIYSMDITRFVSTTYNGGAIRVEDGTSSNYAYVDTDYLELTNNKAPGGGAVQVGHYGDIVLAGTVEGNQSTSTGSGTGGGGGIYGGENSKIYIDSITVSDNSSEVNGGGIATRGILTLGVYAYIEDNTTAATGGGIHIFPTGTLNENYSNWSIRRNTAGTNGGGIYSAGTVNFNYGGTITNNTANNNGGGICSYGTVDVSGVTISSNTGTHGGGMFSGSGGTMTVNSGSIIKNTSANLGGGILSYGTLTIKGGTIGGSAANKNTAGTSGGGVASGDASTISGGTISYNEATANNGGGIFNAGTMIMSGGTVSNNTAKGYGGGIISSGSLTINNANVKIQNNTASTYNAGGINNSEGATLTMSAGTISGNTAKQGGGGIGSAGTLNISGGTISGNTALTTDGGGVLVANNTVGTVNFSGTTKIQNNTANRHGGGIIICKNSTISGATISGNTTTNYNGGGVYAGCGATVTMTSGSISSNTAGQNGGGVYITGDPASTFKISGGSITNNKATSSGAGVYKTSAGVYTPSNSPSCSGNKTTAGVAQAGLSSTCRWTANT